MGSYLETLDQECLTRSDIAKALKISSKQAGRLMSEMTTLRIGRVHRRVMRSDFEAWLIARRELTTHRKPANLVHAARIAAARHLGIKRSPSTGSVIEAARKLEIKMAAGKQKIAYRLLRPEGETPDLAPAAMSLDQAKLLI